MLPGNERATAVTDTKLLNGAGVRYVATVKVPSVHTTSHKTYEESQQRLKFPHPADAVCVETYQEGQNKMRALWTTPPHLRIRETVDGGSPHGLLVVLTPVL